MPTSQLVNLKSDLKSLKFGNDRPGGGDSGEPFVQADISTGIITSTDDKLQTGFIVAGELAPLSNLLLGSQSTVRIGTIDNVVNELLNTDSLIRGGLIGYRQASINQNSRVGGFLNTPKGQVFLANRTLFLIDKATGLSASGVPLAPNQLLNTAIQRGKAAIGLSQTNINYRRALGVSNKIANFDSKLNNINLFSSVLGFTFEKPSQIDRYPNSIKNKLKTGPLEKLFAPTNSPQNKRYSKAIQDALNEQKSKPNYNIYGVPAFINPTIASNEGETVGRWAVFNTTSFKKPTYTNRGTTLKINKSWNDANRDTYAGSGEIDKINLTPILDNINPTRDSDSEIITVYQGKHIIDLVNFRIYAIDSDNYTKSKLMVFRAYITEFSDNTNATWNDIKYAGRGEPFFIYNGFTRAINIGFRVAALSAKEMTPMYEKLNFLMGNVMPDYGNNGSGPFMKGPFVKMTVGNWINRQDGIIKDVNYSVSNDSPWEIGMDTSTDGGLQTYPPLVLPHVVDVKLTFNPIGSQIEGGANRISGKSTTIKHIGQYTTKVHDRI